MLINREIIIITKGGAGVCSHKLEFKYAIKISIATYINQKGPDCQCFCNNSVLRYVEEKMFIISYLITFTPLLVNFAVRKLQEF